MFDLVIRTDCAVTAHGTGAFDIAIKGETIAAVGASGSINESDCIRFIDATGKIVLPGGIDPHVHCSWFIPNPDGTAGLSDPPAVVSRAALHGGTTTIIDFARRVADQTIQKTIEQRDREWVGECYCDYSYHIMVEGKLPPHLPLEVAEAIQAGYPTIKIFTTDITPSRRGRMVDYGSIWEIFKVLSREGGLGVIHAEDNDIVMHMYDKLFRENRTHFQFLSEVHNALSEDLSFRRIIRLAQQTPGTALYMMHVSAGTGVEAIRSARGNGLPIYGETLHQYVMYSDEDYKRANGQIYHTYPSLKSEGDRLALWTGLDDGTIDTIATDELCCSLQKKLQGSRIDDTTGGNAGVEPRISVMYTEMVERRGYALSKFADLISTNAAKILGLYPRKGVLAPGSDADIVVLDPALRRRLKAAEMHESDYSPWEDFEVAVWPCLTVLRGSVVVDKGEMRGKAGAGQYLHRKISDATINGRALS
ncbi:dihydropyrimidinase [Agaricicola taiwanensis]|uniref:Dihydropyrimidinase n=1 Tax=Agaricicola taiwanensis TaxID=591372 RepID=A0A8J2YGD1_9RHOB|nr:amidohydrolase family protein [Agaricicola taiwanensis]GGE38262.1 dihydropyrimidinase [Agaricicola taiwanensis]